MISKACIDDIRELHRFLVEAAKEGEILPRSLNDLYQFVRDYWIYRPKKSGPILATTALHICWDDLAEIRNLFVSGNLRGKGMGEDMVAMCIEEAKTLGVGRVFALTYRVGFFTRLGFRETDKTGLPNKVWTDCLQCMKFPDCDEEAVVFDLERDKFARQKKTLKKAASKSKK